LPWLQSNPKIFCTMILIEAVDFNWFQLTHLPCTCALFRWCRSVSRQAVGLKELAEVQGCKSKRLDRIQIIWDSNCPESKKENCSNWSHSKLIAFKTGSGSKIFCIWLRKCGVRQLSAHLHLRMDCRAQNILDSSFNRARLQ
jgi:hypothetical protein